MKILFRYKIVLLFGVLNFTQVQASPESLNELMTSWLKLEAEKGTLSDRWQTRRQQLTQKLELLELEKNALENLLSKSASEKSEVNENRQELTNAQVALEQEQVFTQSQLELAINEVKKISPRLPPPLQTQWDEKIPILGSKKLSTSEQLESVLNLLKMVSEFDQRVVLHRGILSIEGGTENMDIMVNQIYLGLGHGWYVSDSGDFYGYGKASEDKWQWWSGLEASKYLGESLSAKDVLDVVSVLKSPTTASYLPLPARVD